MSSDSGRRGSPRTGCRRCSALYPLVRDDHLKTLQKCGLLDPPDVVGRRALHRLRRRGRHPPGPRANCSAGAPFRSVLRSLAGLARRASSPSTSGWIRQPAKVLSLRRPRPRPPGRPRPPRAARIRRRASGGDDRAMAEQYFALGVVARRRVGREAGRGGGRLPARAGDRPAARAGAHQPRQHPLRAGPPDRGDGALRARDRPRAGRVRGLLQPRQHPPRPRPLPRGRGVLPPRARGQSAATRRRTSTWRWRSRRTDGRTRPSPTGGRTTPWPRTGSGPNWLGNSASDADRVPGPSRVVSSSTGLRRGQGALAGVPADLVVGAVDAPGVGGEAGGAGHRLHVPVGAVVGHAVFRRFPPPASLKPLHGRRQFLGRFRLRSRNLRRYRGARHPRRIQISWPFISKIVPHGGGHRNLPVTS